MVEINDLHKKFGKVQVLTGVNVKIESGGVIAFLGPNGSGKTTLIKCILGMVIPEKGEITVNSQSVRNNWQYKRSIDYLPQIARFPDNITVEELIRMIKDIRNEESRDEELIKLFALGPFLKKKLGNLSGGTRQKVNIVLTFMFDNPILILDEPTAGLDPVSLIKLKDLIQIERESGKIIILTTHIMNLVEEIADEILFLLDGKILFRGSPADLKSQEGEKNIERAIASILISEDV